MRNCGDVYLERNREVGDRLCEVDERRQRLFRFLLGLKLGGDASKAGDRAFKGSWKNVGTPAVCSPGFGVVNQDLEEV